METVVPKSSHSHAAVLVFDSPSLVLLLWKKKKKRKKSVSVWVNTQRGNREFYNLSMTFLWNRPIEKIFAHSVDFTKNPMANLWLL